MFSREVLGGKGFRAIAQWLHGSTNLEIGECSLLVGLARLLMLEPVVGDAFHRGDVDALKARQVASFCQHPPKNMTPADVDKARGILLGLASQNIADCDAVRAAIRRIEKQYGKREDGVPVGEDSERNEFYASKGLYGRVTVKGDLDAVKRGPSDHVVVEPVCSDTGEGRCQGHPHAGITTGGRVFANCCAGTSERGWVRSKAE